ncbi:alpha carbonic anhydrase 4-like [Benincasa hispida]|uniref:alpha carbonic anhydrase 4-like n=1 Tax=Benincasa hispida TaxID=102211 RepID=UPI0018FFB1F1|nr:alpha carbonic anhydrase 4-like [Benincasa hispida]
MAFFFFFQNFLFLFLLFFFISSFSLSSISMASQSEVGDESPFSYNEGNGNGPKEWGKLKSDWKSCEKGKYQSPINIVEEDVQVLPQLGKLRRDYNPAPAVVKNRGHDVLIRWEKDAGKIIINGTHYKLSQCHWHAPSEHSFNGIRYDLEMHVVHTNDHNETAVVAILYKFGRPDRFLSRLFHHIKSIGKEEKEIGIVNPGDIKFGGRKYYRYIGSLTVPPCTEGVIWTIQKKVRTVSREQVRALKNAIHEDLKKNARPTQALDGRKIQFYTPHK